MLSSLAALALLAALGSPGVAALRRGAGLLDPLEQLAYGAPLGVVASSLILTALASVVGLNAASVASVSVAAAGGAWALWPRPAGSGRATAGLALPLLPALVLAAFAIRWAFLWSGALTRDGEGLWAGTLNLWGDWAQHLGDVTSFAFGDNFPPMQPRLSGHPFAYHYLTSVTAAGMVVLGMDPVAALPLQSFVFSVLILLGLFAFARRLTGNPHVAALATTLFFLGGGLGWWIPLAEATRAPGSLATFLNHPWDQHAQDAANFRWPNAIFALIGPQRGYLYGLPLGLLSLTLLLGAVKEGGRGAFIAAGVVAGLLPFAHLGTFLALAMVTPFLFLLFPTRRWVLFGLVWVFLATPQIALQQAGGTGALGAFRPQLGWVAAPDTWGWFWVKNLGLFLPILALAPSLRDLLPRPVPRFLVAFMPVFVIANLAVFQPWDWDNTKMLAYWFLAVCVFVAAILARGWHSSRAWHLRFLLGVAVLSMILSGLLLNLDQALGRDRHLLLSAEEVALAERVRAETPRRALFAVGLQHNHPVPVLAGRRVVMSFPGWLWSQGMEYRERERDLRAIFTLAPGAAELLSKYRVDYVVIGPNEREKMGADLDGYRARFPSIIRTAGYEVFDVASGTGP